MKKYWTYNILIISAIAMLVGCGRKTAEVPKDSTNVSEEKQVSIEEKVIEEVVVDEMPESTEATYGNETDPEYYINKLANEGSASYKEVIAVNVADYEGKGINSAFVFCGEEDVELGTYYGELWYVSDTNVRLIHNSANGYYSTGQVLRFSNTDKCFFSINEYYVTSAVSYVFGVKTDDAYETEISAYGSLYKSEDSDDFTITISAYDNTYSSADGFALGHTWKPYYFTYDVDKDDFSEYVGKPITMSEANDLCGFDMSAKIEDINGIISDVMVRDNGILTINYSIVNNYENGEYEERYEQVNYNLNESKYVDAWGTGENTLEGSSFGGTYSLGLTSSL